MSSRKVPWLKGVVHAAALTPLVVLVWMYWQGQLGPDPIGEAIRRSGRYALILLLLSLVPTALRLVTGYRGALRVRRALGLYAFMYAGLHFLAFAGLDYGFELDLLLQAMFEGRRIPVGAAALALLIPLAVTSTTGWIKRLGKNWRRLHRLVYLAAGLAVLHYVWTFKETRTAPIVAGAVLLVLLVVRIPPVTRLFDRRQRE